MANNNTIKYTLDFTSNLHDTQTQLNALAKSLKNITTMNFNNVDNKLSKNLNEASLAAIKLEKHLKTALNQDTGKIDMVKLNRSLKGSGDSAVNLSQSLMKAGKAGSEAFMNLARTISQAQAPTVRLSETVNKLWGTLKNTMRWQISSSALNSLTSAFSSAWHYAKELDQTMTKIKVVSDISKEGLDNFTKGAKSVAKELKTSVNEVAKASSIFFQQGDSWETSLRKAETTLKAVNVSFSANAEEMSEYLTAIWNSYNVGAASQELFIDKLAALGAATASSLDEISIAMQKVAATANAVGVNFDQLGSIIATVNSVTRESAETTGTAFKTIFARINDLKIDGSIVEDGFTTKLGDISSGLADAGINVLNVNGSLKDTGTIIEDMGNSWQTMTTNQKVSIAQLVAGKRQYTQLMALFENWDKYQENMVTSSKARGTLDRQNEKAMQSINKELEELKGVASDFWNKIFDKDTVVGLIDFLTDAIVGFENFIDSIGGFGPLLKQIGAIFMRVFSSQISGSLRSVKDNFMILMGQGDKLQQKANKEWLNAFQQMKKNADFSDIQLKELSNMEKLIQVTQKFGERFKGVNSEAKQYIQMQLDMIKNQQELSNKRHAETMSEIDSRKRSTSNDLRSTLREVGQSKNMSIRESAIAANDATLKNIDFNGMTGNLDDIIMQIANTSDNAKEDISNLGQHLISLMGDAKNTSGALDKITESLKSLFQEAQNTISANVEYEIEQDEIAENIHKSEKDIEAGQITENIDDTFKEFDVGQGFVDVQKMQSTSKEGSKDPTNQIIQDAASELGMDSPDQLSAVPVADLTAELEKQRQELKAGTQEWLEYEAAIKKVNDNANFDDKSFNKFESAGGEKTTKKERKALREKNKENKDSEKKEITSLKKKFKTIEKEEKKSDTKRRKNKNQGQKKEEKADKKFLNEKKERDEEYLDDKEDQDKKYLDEKEKNEEDFSEKIVENEKESMEKQKSFNDRLSEDYEKALKDRKDKNKNVSTDIIDDSMKIGSAIMSLSATYDTLKNATQIWGDENATTGEKIQAGMSLVGQTLMSVGSIMEGLTATQKLWNTLTLLGSKLSWQAAKEKIAATLSEIPALVSKALATAAANWYLAIPILALLAAAGISAGASWKGAGDASADSAKAAESANESFSQASARLEEEKGKLNEINNSLEEKKKELEELKQLQLEGNHQHDAEIARLKSEIGLLEQKKAVQEQKVKTAEKSEQNAAKVFAQTNTAWDTVYTFSGNSNGKTLDDYQKVIDEYYQSEEYENALHALEVLDPNSAEYKKIEGELEYISNMSEALVQMREEGIYNVGNRKERGREILQQIQDRNAKIEQEALNESVRSDPTQTMERVKELMKNSGDTFTSEFLNIETGINNLEAALMRGDITQTQFFTSLANNVKSMNMEKAFGDNYEAAEEFFNMVLTYGEGAMNGLTEQFNNGSISTINYMENIMKLNESYVEMGQMAIDRGYVSEDAMGKWVEQLKEANEQLEKIKNILPEIGEDSSIKDMASYLSEIGYSAESLGQFAKEKLNIDLDVKTNETIEEVLGRSTNAYRIASEAIVEEYQKQMAEVYEAQYMINSTMEKQLNNISMTATKDENGNYKITNGTGIASNSGDVQQFMEDKNIEFTNKYDNNEAFKAGLDEMEVLGMQQGMALASGKSKDELFSWNDVARMGYQKSFSTGNFKSFANNATSMSAYDNEGNLRTITMSQIQSGDLNYQDLQALKNAGYGYHASEFIDQFYEAAKYAEDMKITEGQVDAYSTGRSQSPGLGEAAYGLSAEQMGKAQEAVDKWKDLQEQLEDSYEELADAWDEEYLARLEDDLEKHQQILDEYQKQIDNVDWFNDLLPEDSFLKLQNQTKQYERNINQLTSQLNEFNRVYNLIPRNAEEAQVIFDQLSSLGDGIQNSVEQIHDLKYELMSLESNMFINLLDENGEILDAEFDRLDKLHESIMDTSEYNESTKQLLLRGGSSALQLSRDKKDRVQKREEEDKKIYDLVKDLNDKIFKKEKELLEMTSKEAAEERAEQRADIEKEIAELQTEISDAAKAVAEIVGENNDELIKKLVGDHQQAALLIKQAYEGVVPEVTGNEDGGTAPPSSGEYQQNIMTEEAFQSEITKTYTGPAENNVRKLPHYAKENENILGSYISYSQPIFADRNTAPSGYKVTSDFNLDTTNGKRVHHGEDYSFNVDTPLYAGIHGFVKEVTYYDDVYGNYVVLGFMDGAKKQYTAKFAHLNADSIKHLTIGQEVDPKTEIGKISSYNNKGGAETNKYWTGPHLHLEVMKEGAYVSPKSVFDFNFNYKGSKSTPKGKSLVGEIGTELIIYPDGSSYLAGINGPEVLDLPQGTQVFNARDTQNILNSNGTPTGNIQGFADGSYNELTLTFEDEAVKENTEAIEDNTKTIKEERDAIIESELEIVNSMLKNAKELESDFGSSLVLARGQYEDETKLISNKLLLGEISEAQYYVQQGRNEKIYGQRMQYEAELMMDAWEEAKERYLSLGIYNQETEEALNEAYEKIIELSEKGAEVSQKADEQLSEYVQKQIEGLEAISAEIEYQYQLKIDAMDKEIQARQNLIDLQQSYNSHMKDLRQVENDIEKTLRQSKANLQWLDKETRDLLFNQADYNEILQKTNSIQFEITQLYTDYQEKISSLNEYELDQASLLTEEYEAQVAAKKEELETLQISLQLNEKQNALNSALMERNVRVFAGGRWRQIANIQNVQKAYEDYQSVVNQLEEQEITNAENKAIREEEALNRNLELKKAAYEAEIAMMQEENEKLQHELDIMTSEFDIANVSLDTWNEKLLDVNKVMSEAYEGLKNFGKKVNKKIDTDYLITSILDNKKEWENLEKERKKAIENGQLEQANIIKEKQDKIAEETQFYYKDLSETNADIAKHLETNSYESLKDIQSKSGQVVQTISDMAKNVINQFSSMKKEEEEEKPSKEPITENKNSQFENYDGTGDYAILPDGTKIKVKVENGKTQTPNLPAGTIVYPEGAKGDGWEIKGGEGGDYDSSEKPVTSTGSTGGGNNNPDKSTSKIPTISFTGIKLPSIFVDIQKNAKGTRNARSGISQVNELGIELLATNDGQFIELNPHEKIFNNEQMNFLYDFSRRGIESTEKAIQSVNSIINESLYIDNVTLELPNVTDTDSFVNGLNNLTSYIKNMPK